MWSIPKRAKGGARIGGHFTQPHASRAAGPASGGLAGVAGIQVIEYLFRLGVRERLSETILHLLQSLLPGGAVHGRRIGRDVVEAVADDAAADRQIAPGRVLELKEFCCSGARCGAHPAEQQRAEAGSEPRCAASHATSTLRV